MMNKIQTKNIALCAMSSALLAMGAWITIPFAVPFTMQTFVLFLLLHTLGGGITTLSVLIYICLGFVGAPVYSGFNNGYSAFSGPTGGYIIGFVLAGTLYFALQRFFNKSRALHLATPFCAMLLVYLCGTAWYMLFMDNSVGVYAAASACVLPYIVPDAIKIILAMLLSKRLKKALR